MLLKFCFIYAILNKQEKPKQPPKQKFGVVLKNTFKLLFDNTCNIDDFK